MTKQTQLSKTQAEQIHLINISEIIGKRLEWIKIHPAAILNISPDKSILDFNHKLLKKKYPQSKIFENIKNLEKLKLKLDLIFAVVNYAQEDFFKIFPVWVSEWKEYLKPGGLLIFGLFNPAADIREIGDFLSSLAFQDIVLDRDVLENQQHVIYGHALVQKSISVPLSQMGRL